MYEIKSQYGIGYGPNPGPIEINIDCSQKLFGSGPVYTA